MMDAIAFLAALDLASAIQLFWFMTILELPRYFIGAVLVGACAIINRTRPQAHPVGTDRRVSVILAGHNEAPSLRRAVEGLAEQTIARRPGTLEVVVIDDGSTDDMSDVANALLAEGLIEKTFRLQRRGGKSAAVNLGFAACTGDIIIIADIDTTFDRNAIEAMLAYFDDPHVGAVSGNLGVRNEKASLVTRHQAIEYAQSIGLGRQSSDVLGTLSIVSGAFGGFRRQAIEAVGGQDVEVGEDADLTLKLRRAGWRIRFAADARALTSVPETITALIAQRLRWDRGLITIWLRKFRSDLDPRRSAFRLMNVLALIDVILFQVVLALAFPVYIVWLWAHLGDLAPTILLATLIVYAFLDIFIFLIAMLVGLDRSFRLVAYVPLYSVIQVTLMRVVRLVALFQEVFLRSSYSDPYVPGRVMKQVDYV